MRMGRKKGNPITSTPARMGMKATDAAAMGTVGMRRYFIMGTLLGRVCVMDVTVALDASAMESMVANHAEERDIKA
jgi:hypothetical protein